jgi:hypothetical protein
MSQILYIQNAKDLASRLLQYVDCTFHLLVLSVGMCNTLLVALDATEDKIPKGS